MWEIVCGPIIYFFKCSLKYSKEQLRQRTRLHGTREGEERRRGGEEGRRREEERRKEGKRGEGGGGKEI
jgi:hypothetical protein